MIGVVQGKRTCSFIESLGGGTPHSLNNLSNYETANLANKLLEKTIINLCYES